MGWYTTGPGEFSYKYGNALAAARASKLGVVTIVPRLVCVDANDDIREDHEFLGTLQQRILKSGRPWKALPFDVELDASGESMRLPDRDLGKMLRRIGKVVLAHRTSIFEEIGSGAAEVVRMRLGAEVHWKVARDEWETLVQWLNGPLAGAPISLAALAEGQVDDNGYQPPASLEKAFAALDADRRARHLAASALGHALLINEELALCQPEDDSQKDIWEADGAGPPMPESTANERCLVLWTWAEIPLLELLVKALDMPAAVADSVFYLHAADVEIELPPEPDLPPALVAAGMKASTYVAQKILVALPAVRELIPDLKKPLHAGWHPSATVAELTVAAEASSAVAVSLRARLTPAADRDGIGTVDRLQAIAEVAADERDRQFAAHIVTGRGTPKGPIDGFLIVLLTVLGPELDLPGPMRKRLEALLQRAS